MGAALNAAPPALVFGQKVGHRCKTACVHVLKEPMLPECSVVSCACPPVYEGVRLGFLCKPRTPLGNAMRFGESLRPFHNGCSRDPVDATSGLAQTGLDKRHSNLAFAAMCLR